MRYIFRVFNYTIRKAYTMKHPTDQGPEPAAPPSARTADEAAAAPVVRMLALKPDLTRALPRPRSD